MDDPLITKREIEPVTIFLSYMLDAHTFHFRLYMRRLSSFHTHLFLTFVHMFYMRIP